MPNQHRIILDCDPGHDDAVAIMLALGNPSIDLLGVTTVGGNQTVDRVTTNARGILATCGREDVRVYAGASKPLVREIEVAESIHGESGLDGVELQKPSTPLGDESAIDFIIETVMTADADTITLVATGPLTNLALAIAAEPRIVERVREVTLMGGAIHGGNWTPVAEFNIWVDPEAADAVVTAGWPVTMVGLDVTHRVLATPQVESDIRAIGTPTAELFAGLMDFFRDAYRDAQGFDDPPVHDPCALIPLIAPDAIECVRARIRVETAGNFTTGMTVVDLRSAAPDNCPTRAAVAIDADAVWALVADAIRAIG